MGSDGGRWKSWSIRPVEEGDAAAFLMLCRRLDDETTLMMLEPGERTTTVAAQRAQIAAVRSSANQTILVAAENGELLGYIGAEGGAFRRNRHSAYIVIGVLAAYAGRGIGRALFAALEAWARGVGIHRLELTVQAHNERALGLYQRMGFAIEGTRRDSLFVDGAYVDEYALAKLL